MPTGMTTTGSLADSLPSIRQSARIRREYPPVVAKLCEFHSLKEGQGLNWNEVELARLTASDITETTELDNAQQITDIIRTVTPTQTGLTTIITDRAYMRISKNAAAQIGQLAQDALERKKDLDGLTTIDGATNSQPGAGSTLTSGVISAGMANIMGNTTEGGTGPFNLVLHAFQKKDIQDEVVEGIGTYPIPEGISEKAFKMGWEGSLFGANVFTDNNITIDGSADAKGGLFDKKGMLFVQGRPKRSVTKRREEIGGGADQLFMYDEYAYAERQPNATSVLVWEIYSDATAPTT